MKKIIIEEQPKQKQQYPYIGKSQLGRVVLFTSETCGFILEDPTGKFNVGHRSTSWAKEDFTPVKGQVILEND